MKNKDELFYKINAIIEFLKENGGYECKVYDKLCPDLGEPDSNIVEYAEDVKKMVKDLYSVSIDEDDLPF